MHSISNCCRNASQNDNGKSNPRSQTGHPHKSTNSRCRREPGGEGTPLPVWQEWTLTATTRKDSLCMSKKEKILSKEPNLGSDIPTPGPITWENHHSKIHMHPNIHCSTTYKSQNRTCTTSTDRLKGKEGVLHTDNGLVISHEKVLLKLWNYATGHQVDGPWRIIY